MFLMNVKSFFVTIRINLYNKIIVIGQIDCPRVETKII